MVVLIVKNKTVCFTGHRKIPTEEVPTVKANLRKVLIDSIENGYCYFGAGGAIGFDTLAANAVLELKKLYSNIKFILVLPCVEQTKGWDRTDIIEYNKIKSKSDKIVYTSEHYFRGCMQKRNRHLVDNSSLCICYLTQKIGGTAYTVDYAYKRGLKVINVIDRYS